MGRKILSPDLLNSAVKAAYNLFMLGMLARAALLVLGFIVVAGADAQARQRQQTPAAAAPAAMPADKRDGVVPMSGTFSGRPYWLALAQCGGIYFKLKELYTDAAVRARVVKPDPKANAEYTKALNEAIKTATRYFEGAERFLMADRGLERADAVLTYDGPSRATGERLKTIDAALAAAKVCPALYQSCREAYPKRCTEQMAPDSFPH